MKIKRYIFLVAALLLMGQGASAWSGSGNSASDPILIANANDWNTLATNVARSNRGVTEGGTLLHRMFLMVTIAGSKSGTLFNTIGVIRNTPRVFKISFGVITQAGV